MIIKAMLFILLAQNTDGQVMYANGLPLPDCKAETIQQVLDSLPAAPRGMRLEYTCMEPGPARIVVEDEIE